jgi:hypothetical protein
MAAKAVRLKMEEAEAQRLSPEEVCGPIAPRAPLNNLDRLMNWVKEFLSRQKNSQVYPVPIIRD